MIKILSHRGYWLNEFEKNTEVAFKRSFELGFGTEIDIRDYKGELVISHDIADEKSLTLEFFFQLYKSFNNDLPLALNIKSDGLQLKLSELLTKYDVKNYFVFDMSVPDGLKYIEKEYNVFTRQSEYEEKPSFYEKAIGVWLDEFNYNWITKEILKEHQSNNKNICIVSPDLHNRGYLNEWENFKAYDKEINFNNVMLCTDFPEKAKTFFYDE